LVCINLAEKKNVDGKNAEKKTSKNKWRSKKCRGKNVEKNISNEKMSIVWECRMKITVKYLEDECESGGEDDRGE
jgi:hypothetical protein